MKKKNSDIFHISDQNIRRGGSNEYLQSIYFFWAEIGKNNVYPCKPQFYFIKVGFKVSKLCRRVFVMERTFRTSYLRFYTATKKGSLSI